jgi:hypothetical protein
MNESEPLRGDRNAHAGADESPMNRREKDIPARRELRKKLLKM